MNQESKTTLTKETEVFITLLEKRIESGENIMKKPTSSMEDLESSRKEYNKWDSYNSELFPTFTVD